MYPDESEKVGISITEADELFLEVRIVNILEGVGRWRGGRDAKPPS